MRSFLSGLYMLGRQGKNALEKGHIQSRSAAVTDSSVATAVCPFVITLMVCIPARQLDAVQSTNQPIVFVVIKVNKSQQTVSVIKTLLRCQIQFVACHMPCHVGMDAAVCLRHTRLRKAGSKQEPSWELVAAVQGHS